MRPRQLDRLRGRDVVLLTGQSNAFFYGAPRTDWPKTERDDSGTLFASDTVQSGAWITYSELGYDGTGGWYDCGGFALALSVAMRNAGLSPAISVQAWGGASAQLCHDNIAANSLTIWGTRLGELSEIRSVSIVVSQGEDECATGNPWQTVWEDSIVSIRTTLLLASAKLYVVQIPTAYVPDTFMSTLPYMSDVRDEQAALVAEDGNALLIDPDVALTVDGIHHDYLTETRIARAVAADIRTRI